MSPDMVNYVWIVAGFFAVLVVAGIFWWFLKTYLFSSGPSLFGGRERRRLGLVEWASIGGGRQLILVRRDEVEHLILTGGPIDVVVESGIGKESPALTAREDDLRGRDDVRRTRSEASRFEEADFEVGSGRGAGSAGLTREGGSRRASDHADGKDSERFHGIGVARGETTPRASVLETKD